MNNLKVNTWLPVFPGFYNSIFEPDETDEMYYINKERQEKGLSELDWNQFEWDYEEYQNNICLQCTDHVDGVLKDLDFANSVTFERLSYPQYYNFRNDSIDCEIEFTEKQLQAIYKYLETNADEFKEYIKDHYTSCSGFISSYSNDSEAWLYDFDEIILDSHQCGAILDFVMRNEDGCDAQIWMYDHCESRLECKNWDQVTEMEFCSECSDWVKPEEFNGNCCDNCNDFKVQNFERVVCTECRTVIENQWEKRSIVHKLQLQELKPDQVLCNDCICVLA